MFVNHLSLQEIRRLVGFYLVVGFGSYDANFEMERAMQDTSVMCLGIEQGPILFVFGSPDKA